MTTLRFHRKIYRMGSLQEVMESFGEFGTFNLEKDGEYFVLEISDMDEEFEEILPHEIANYALAQTIENLRS